MTDANTKRQAYEAEKAALDVCNAPASAYARLDEAYFGDGQTASGPAGWLARNILYVLPAVVAGTTALGFVIFEGPKESFHAANGWLFGKTELQEAQGTATIASATAPYAGPKAAAEVETLAATAHYAELRAKAEAEKAEADAEAAKIGVCKIRAEAAAASGINKYDIAPIIGSECQNRIGLNAPTK